MRILGVDAMVLLVGCGVCGGICAFIAAGKARNVFGWFLIGAFLLMVGILLIVLQPPLDPKVSASERVAEPPSEEGLPTKEEIRRLLEPMIRKTRRFALQVSIPWFVIVSIVGVVFSLAPSLNPMDDTTTAVSTMLFMILFIGMLPTLVIRQLILRDIKTVPLLIRNGTIYRARVVARDFRSFRGGASHLVVSWLEGDREQRAHFDVDKLEDEIRPGVIVVTRPRARSAAVVVNDKLFVANRPRVVF